MKKTLIALAVAGLSFNAMAIDFTQTKPEDTTSKYPKELAIPAGTVVANATAETVIVEAGVALTTPYVRFELANGTFAGIPTLATDDTNPVSWVITAGGKDQRYVVFNKKLTAGGTANSIVDEKLTLTATSGIKLASQAKVDVTYSIHETAAGAINNTGALMTKSGTQLDFVDSLEVVAKQAASIKEIDLAPAIAAHKGKVFTGPATITGLVDLQVSVVSGLKKQTGATAVLADLVTSGTWTLTGDFSAAAAADPVKAGANVFTTTKDKATLVAAAPQVLGANQAVTYEVGGSKLINGGVYGAELNLVPVNGYVFGSYKFANAAVIKKNGSSTEIDLALNPVGAYDNYIRVTNKGSAAGEVTFNVINDQGEVKQTTLASVLGADKGLLAAGASTTQMNIKDIADKAGFTTVDGKLRLVIDTTIPRAGNDDMVVAQSYAANKTNGVLTLLK
ncbi:hypothetical protein [Aeromonas caviae]|uniref:hypothetical protein n=1 Tax=Aeromonas caviae TaxID=648 RepID=UPI002F42BBBC